ncbi:hypothetical protein B0H13DRAFT_1073721 [Mycena leptocephala]|nr:hypothetical protein B0H13DRAFT_1073721 [Mycena leptocephala]
MSVHDPAEAASWTEYNWGSHLLNSIRNSGRGRPFAWLLSPIKPALAIFGQHREPIVNMAQTLAHFSGSPVLARPASDNPAVPLLTHDANHQNGHDHFNHNTGGNTDETGRAADEGNEIREEKHIPGDSGNGGGRDADHNGAKPIENGSETTDHEPNRDGGAQAHGGGDDGPPLVTVDDKWTSPIHRTNIELHLKLQECVYDVRIGYTLAFIIDRKPKEITEITEPVSHSEVSALVDFKIETVPRETQIDHSYASIGLLGHKKKSIADQEFLHRGSDLPGKTYKYAEEKQTEKGMQGTFGWGRIGPMISAAFSFKRNKTTKMEATDDRVRCLIFLLAINESCQGHAKVHCLRRSGEETA